MQELKNKNFLHRFSIIAFFAACFVYLLVFNHHHITFQEQSQLFIYSNSYFNDFIGKPGGLSAYIGAFFTQFFISYFVGTVIITLACILIYALTGFILNKYRINGIVISFIPVLFLLALVSDYQYTTGYTIGVIMALLFTAFYHSVDNDKMRYFYGFTGFIILYIAAGGFMLLAAILCISCELFIKKKRILFIVPGYVLYAFLVPSLAKIFIYYVSWKDALMTPVLIPYAGNIRIYSLLLVFYIPLVIIIFQLWKYASRKTVFDFRWKWNNITAGIILLSGLAWIIRGTAWDPRTEDLFRIDYYIQNARWEDVLKQSARYHGTNRLIMYFTNLALYKTGRMGDSLFHYNQTGKDDLWLEWPGGKLSLFFGADVFYHLGYFNETYRRSYDAMILNGQNQRALKILALISIVNGNYVHAKKYLTILSKTLFYRKWAKHYLKMLENPDLMKNDTELSQKRRLLLKTDFLIDPNYPDQTLFRLLQYQPANRMAYEYFLASLLLDKNISAFASYITNLKTYGFSEIPVHYEEALLVYMNQIKKNIVPEGYRISLSTVERFDNYYSDYKKAASTYQGKSEMMARTLIEKYGTTYWFYLHFLNNKANIR